MTESTQSLYVKELGGPTHTIKIPLSHTVLDLKRLVEGEFGVSVESQKLILRGKVFPDNQIIGELYNPADLRFQLVRSKESKSAEELESAEREFAARQARIAELRSLIAPLEAERVRIEREIRPLAEELSRLHS